MRRYYDAHHAMIQRIVPPDNLCVLRLGDGWEPLVSGSYRCCISTTVSHLADEKNTSADFWIKMCLELASHTKTTPRRCIWRGNTSGGVLPRQLRSEPCLGPLLESPSFVALGNCFEQYAACIT